MNNLIHARRAFHNYSLFIIHYSLFTEKYNAPIYDRGVKIRGTTLIRSITEHLRCSVTGAPVPVIPDGLEVACKLPHEGLHHSPLARMLSSASFPHCLCISSLFYTKAGQLSTIIRRFFCTFSYSRAHPAQGPNIWRSL